MNLSDVIFLGYVLNVLVFIVALALAIHIQKELGLQVLKKIHEQSVLGQYKVSRWIYIIYAVPYFPIYLMIRAFYEYNKVKTDNLLESYEKYINREPSGLMKIFIINDKGGK